MKLCFSPRAGSLSPHIAMRESGLSFTPVRASTRTHKLDDGTDYYAIDPRGYVPQLELDDGQRLLDRFRWVDQQLEGKAYTMGDGFSVADAYLFVVSGWGKYVDVDLSGYNNLQAFLGRVAARPAVQQAMKAEGLLG